jgi:3-methyladenine DNA glycosylase AlkC
VNHRFLPPNIHYSFEPFCSKEILRRRLIQANQTAMLVRNPKWSEPDPKQLKSTKKLARSTFRLNFAKFLIKAPL